MSDAASDPPAKRVYTPETNAGRWTVRDVGEADKAAALAAAKRREMPIGEWLGEAIRAYIAAEREPMGEVLPPSRGLPALSLEDIAQAVEIAARIAEIQGQPPRRLLGRAMRRLGDRLGR